MSDSEINLGFISGVVSTAVEHRMGDWGESVSFSIRHFVKQYEGREGGTTRVEHEFKMDCQTRAKQENPCYPQVRTLAPGDWVHLRYQMDQSKWDDKNTGAPKTWDKRMIVGLEAVRRAAAPTNPQAVIPNDPAAEPPLPF